MSSNGEPIAKIGILSIGDMGAGIARLLIRYGFAVATNCQGRSEDTIGRARNANIELLASDQELVQQCAVILSVVPPRDAEATAKRIIEALSDAPGDDLHYFADLNAVAPSSCKRTAALFADSGVPVRYIDGCILGLPPRLKESDEALVAPPDDIETRWSRPRIPTSGPHPLTALPYGEPLAKVLNLKHISPDVGAASGLKMCYAAMTKGFIALATQSFTTAHSLGVADALREEMAKGIPTHLQMASHYVPNMPPKAYRWVKEMEEIALTMHEEGGWGKDLFMGTAEVFKAVADDEVLGKEKIGKRKRGTSVGDVAALLSEGLEKKQNMAAKE